MKLMDQLPQQLKASADVAAPATAGAYMVGWLPSTWGEWAACLAGLWALIQIGDWMWKKVKGKR